jgi:predicted ATPase
MRSVSAPQPCRCDARTHAPKLVVVTGGPGAGKTALLELGQKHFCSHVVVLPEAASIVFGGGFPRRADLPWAKAAQRAIYHVQRQLEQAALEEGGAAVILCDRGTVDGVAYWPDGAVGWAAELGTTIAAEQARYAAVIQLRTPAAGSYNHTNPLRLESASEAARSDARIAAIWTGHAHHHVIAAEHRFIDKVRLGLQAIESEIPPCCRNGR